MIKKMQWQLEKLDESFYRAKVIGGWILLHCNQLIVTDGKKQNLNMSESMCFLTDPDHQWVIVKPLPDVKVEKVNLAKDFEALKDDPRN